MTYSIVIILLTAALFLALILNLAVKPRFYGKLTQFFTLSAVIGGAVVYGYGFAHTENNLLLCVFRAAFSICSMFLGKNDLSSISKAPLFEQQWFLTFFWLIHMAAFYSTASAVLTKLGSDAMQKLRLALTRQGNLVVIFGESEEVCGFAKSFADEKSTSVVFCAELLPPGEEASLTKQRILVRTEKTAVHPNAAFLRMIGVKRKSERLIEVFALSEDNDKNIQFAREFMDSLEKIGCDPAHTTITISGNEENAAGLLQVTDKKYGFGHVMTFTAPELAARMMIRQYAPWETVSFDEEGRAKENLEVLIAGFGAFGQSVLKYIVMNGQFEGSSFRADVFAPNARASSGYLFSDAPELDRQYAINLHDNDARSPEFYDFLREHAERLKYIVVCTGSDSLNEEITGDILKFFRNRNIDRKVVEISATGLRIRGISDICAQQYAVLSRDVLVGAKIDEAAMKLNHMYMNDESVSAWEHWINCDHFSRMSSRASADFMPAILKAAGGKVEDLSDKLRENLGRTEHLRWCAFHYCSGFSVMSAQEWEERAQRYLKEKKETGKASIKIGKNLAARTHACLISWEELKELDAREMAITGEKKDYQQADINNVLMIPEVLGTERA